MSDMASKIAHVNLSYEQLEALCGERETLVHTLGQQLRAVELERDEARGAMERLTQALRRRGCCDHDSNGHAL